MARELTGSSGVHEIHVLTARYAERLAAVTGEQAGEVARKYADPNKATLIVVGDSQYFLDDLKAMRGDVEVVSIDDLDLSRTDLRKPASE